MEREYARIISLSGSIVSVIRSNFDSIPEFKIIMWRKVSDQDPNAISARDKMIAHYGYELRYHPQDYA